MGKTWVGLILLAAIFSGILINATFLDKTLEEVRVPIVRAEELAFIGEYEDAKTEIREAVNLWQEHQKYFNSFMKHEVTEVPLALLLKLEFALANDLPVDFQEIYDTLDDLSQAEKIALEQIL